MPLEILLFDLIPGTDFLHLIVDKPEFDMKEYLNPYTNEPKQYSTIKDLLTDAHDHNCEYHIPGTVYPHILPIFKRSKDAPEEKLPSEGIFGILKPTSNKKVIYVTSKFPLVLRHKDSEQSVESQIYDLVQAAGMINCSACYIEFQNPVKVYNSEDGKVLKTFKLPKDGSGRHLLL